MDDKNESVMLDTTDYINKIMDIIKPNITKDNLNLLEICFIKIEQMIDLKGVTITPIRFTNCGGVVIEIFNVLCNKIQNKPLHLHITNNKYYYKYEDCFGSINGGNLDVDNLYKIMDIFSILGFKIKQ